MTGTRPRPDSGPESAAASASGRLGWPTRLLLGGYPPWWRFRYDDEMRDTVLALREDGRWDATDRWDLFRGLVAAWFSPTPLPSENAMTDPTRRLIPRSAWGLLLFVFAGSTFAKVIEDPSFGVAARQHPLLTWCVGALGVAAVATAVLTALASIPSIAALLRVGRDTGGRTLMPLLIAPVSVGAFMITVVAARSAADGTPVQSASHIAAFVALVLVALAGGVATTVAVMHVAMQVPDSPGVAASRRIAMVGVGLLTTAAAVTVLGWTITAALESPQLLRSSNGLLNSPTSATLALALLSLTGAAVLCGQNAYRAVAQQPSRRSAK